MRQSLQFSRETVNPVLHMKLAENSTPMLVVMGGGRHCHAQPASVSDGSKVEALAFFLSQSSKGLFKSRFSGTLRASRIPAGYRAFMRVSRIPQSSLASAG